MSIRISVSTTPIDNPASAKFGWLFVSADEELIQDEEGQEILMNAVFAHSPSLSDLKRAICQISHALTVAAEKAGLLRGLLQLLNSLIARSASALPDANYTALKGYVFALESIQKLCTSSTLPEQVRGGRATEYQVDSCMY